MDEVFVRAKERTDELLSHPDPRGWFFKTAANVIHELDRDCRKRSKLIRKLFARDILFYVQPHFYTREQRFIAEIWSVEPEAFGRDMTDEELDSIKREILAGFPGEDGELLRMSLEKKLSPREIARLRGTSVGAVRIKLTRLYDKLTAAVHERFEDNQ